ncbi:hypothetical protein CHUAL_011058 [Chamberlinius hualienensis]
MALSASQLLCLCLLVGDVEVEPSSSSGDSEYRTVMHSELRGPMDLAMRDSPSLTGPYFDVSTPTNVTAQQGKTAFLHCQVRQLGNKTVSWVRHRDLHILTVGRYTYITDQRFQAYHLANTEDWTLQIRYTQQRDAGIYECQVSTEPKLNLLISLNVVVPKSSIEDAPDMHVKSGSTIILNCVITDSPEPPVYVFWYHEEKMLNYDTNRRTIRVERVSPDTTINKLIISNALMSDSGNYTCTPSNADPTHIIVHVLNGEKPAAMQHGGRNFAVYHHQSCAFVRMLLTIGYYLLLSTSVSFYI